MASLVLIPQVVDAVSPIPTLAAGGIAERKGVAAALVLGVQGVNIGTRFLASTESPVNPRWKQAILGASSQDTIKADFWAEIFPPGVKAYGATPRVLSSEFVEEWRNRRDEARQHAEELREQVGRSIAQGEFGEILPFTGEAAGLIREILPAAEIVRRLADEAEQAMNRGAKYLS